MKFQYLFIITLIVSTTFALGKSSSVQIQELQNQVNAVTTTTALGETGIATAGAWPSLEKGGWFLALDPLFWKAKVGGTSFVATNDQTGIHEPIQGSILENSLDWEFGIKAQLGKYLTYDKWGLFAEFSYFKTHGSCKANAEQANTLIPLKGPYANSAFLATSAMKFSFLNLDANLCRYYFISRTLALQPTFGLRNTWNTTQQETAFSQGSYLLNNVAHTKDSSKMWGIGPNAAMNSTWYLGNSLHIFGLLSASVLYSYFQVYQDSFITTLPTQNLFLSQKNHKFIPNMQWSLGLGWSHFFNEKSSYVQLQLGYEALYYWRLNQMLSLYEFKDSLRVQNISEDASMYGVTFKIQVFF